MIESQTTDAQLTELAAGGCQDAAREIVARYGGKLLGFLNRRNSRSNDNEDILQETFITVFDRLHTFDGSRSFSAWIFGIARNKANEHVRKIIRMEKLHADSAVEKVAPATPSSHVDQIEQSAVFWNQAKQLLSEEQFDCLWLRYQADLSISEIVESTGKSESAVKVSLFRARKILFSSIQNPNPPTPPVCMNP